MPKRTYILCLLLWLLGCTPVSEPPSEQTAATPATGTTVPAATTLAPSPSPAASETPLPATARPLVPTPAATPTASAGVVADSAWCVDTTAGTVTPAPWASHPDTLAAAELRNYLIEMGVTKLCLPPQVATPSLEVDWNAAATPPTADSGRRIRVKFQDSGTVNLIYSTYDFSLGTEYIIHATLADYEAVQAGTHPALITTNDTPGFVHIGHDGYAGVIKAFVYPFADHYLALTTGLSYEAGVDDPDVLAAAMTEPPYPEEGTAALRALDEMVASFRLTPGVPPEAAETRPRTQEIESWSSTSPDGQWEAHGQ